MLATRKILIGLLAAATLVGACAVRGERSDRNPMSVVAGSDADIFEPMRQPYREALLQTKEESPEAAATIRRLARRVVEIRRSSSAWPEPYSAARASTLRLVHEIEGMVAEAATQVETDPLRAHETLEKIRIELSTYRDSLGVDHPSDAMTIFHASMEGFVLRVEDSEAIDWEYERGAIDRLRSEIYELSRAFEDEDQCRVTGLQQVLESVAAAVESEEPARLQSEAERLRKEYVKLFRSCG